MIKNGAVFGKLSSKEFGEHCHGTRFVNPYFDEDNLDTWVHNPRIACLKPNLKGSSVNIPKVDMNAVERAPSVSLLDGMRDILKEHLDGAEEHVNESENVDLHIIEMKCEFLIQTCNASVEDFARVLFTSLFENLKPSLQDQAQDVTELQIVSIQTLLRKYHTLLTQFGDGVQAQAAILQALTEASVKKKAYQELCAHLLTPLYELEVVEDELIFTEWHEKLSSRKGTEIIREKSQSFIEWIKETSEGSETESEQS